MGRFPHCRVFALRSLVRVCVWFLFLLLVASGFIAGASMAAEPLIMDAIGENTIDLKPHTTYFIDPAAELTVEDVAASVAAFQPIATPYIDFGLGEFRVWMRFALYNPAATQKVWRLDTGRTFPEELDIFLVRPGGAPELVLRSTADDPFHARPIPMRTITADLVIPPGQLAEVLIGFRSSSTTYFPMTTGPPSGVVRARANEAAADALFNGALLAMLVMSLWMTPVTGWRLSLAFVSYIVAGMFYVSHADGYTFKYLWPNGQQLNDSLNLSFILLMSACGFNFARILFSLKTVWPAYNRFMTVYSGLALLFAVLAIFFIDVRWLMVIGYLIVPAGAVIQPITGYLVYRRGYLGATPYLAGGLIVLFTFAYAFIAHVYPGHFNLDRTLDAGHLALLTESFAFAAAIVIRLLGLQRERDNALKAELVAVREKLDMSAALRDAQKQYLEARKLSSKRRDQLSSVSHDLQQPLAMLRYKIGNMANHDESSVDEMHKALDYLEQLARDQIKADDSDSPGNQSDGAMETFSLNVIFENAKQMFQDDAKAKGLKFRIRSLDAAVDANAVALMRVVGNLLQNAIRHTQSGGILLGARRRGDRIQVEIWDTGGGIKPEEMERVLKRREKGEGSAGAGLGLAIVRDISEQYDLNFRLISKPGRGACARFDIPRHC